MPKTGRGVSRSPAARGRRPGPRVRRRLETSLSCLNGHRPSPANVIVLSWATRAAPAAVAAAPTSPSPCWGRRRRLGGSPRPSARQGRGRLIDVPPRSPEGRLCRTRVLLLLGAPLGGTTLPCPQLGTRGWALGSRWEAAAAGTGHPPRRLPSSPPPLRPPPLRGSMSSRPSARPAPKRVTGSGSRPRTPGAGQGHAPCQVPGGPEAPPRPLPFPPPPASPRTGLQAPPPLRVSTSRVQVLLAFRQRTRATGPARLGASEVHDASEDVVSK